MWTCKNTARMKITKTLIILGLIFCIFSFFLLFFTSGAKASTTCGFELYTGVNGSNNFGSLSATSTYYFGELRNANFTDFSALKIKIPFSGTINHVEFHNESAPSASSELATLKIVVNNSTTTIFDNLINFQTANRLSSSTVSIPVTAGDDFAFALVIPTMSSVANTRVFARAYLDQICTSVSGGNTFNIVGVNATSTRAVIDSPTADWFMGFLLFFIPMSFFIWLFKRK